MKHISILALILSFSLKSLSFDAWEFAKTYALPCAITYGVSMAASSKNSVTQNTALGCSILIIGGEFVKPTETVKNVKLLEESFDFKSAEARLKLREENEHRFLGLENRLETSEIKNRDMIKAISAEVSVNMERMLLLKLQEKMKSLDVIPEIEAKMIERVKLEVIAELKSRQDDMVSEVVEKVIRRVVAEPVVVNPKTDKKK